MKAAAQRLQDDAVVASVSALHKLTSLNEHVAQVVAQSSLADTFVVPTESSGLPDPRLLKSEPTMMSTTAKSRAMVKPPPWRQVVAEAPAAVASEAMSDTTPRKRRRRGRETLTIAQEKPSEEEPSKHRGLALSRAGTHTCGDDVRALTRVVEGKVDDVRALTNLGSSIEDAYKTVLGRCQEEWIVEEVRARHDQWCGQVARMIKAEQIEPKEEVRARHGQSCGQVARRMKAEQIEPKVEEEEMEVLEWEDVEPGDKLLRTALKTAIPVDKRCRAKKPDRTVKRHARKRASLASLGRTNHDQNVKRRMRRKCKLIRDGMAPPVSDDTQADVSDDIDVTIVDPHP